jgi:dihydropteroate synthase
MQKLRVEDTYFPINKHLRLKDKLFDLSSPKVMGIVNLTPDSFHDKSRFKSDIELLKHIEKIIQEGVDILDIGGYSTRPGSQKISITDEIYRIQKPLEHIRREFPTIPISLDTFRGDVAKVGLEQGVDIINDISAWNIDPSILDVVEHYSCPYILMHMNGTLETMHEIPVYSNLFKSITSFFSKKIAILLEKGIHDIVIDPGFGFSKTLEQNYQLLSELGQLNMFGKPILVGVSRKSMICKKLTIEPDEALNGTSILNTIALLKGASILRVHDVKEARQAIQLIHALH